MRMRHPKLNTVIEVPDVESTIAVHRDGGWVEEAEPVQHHPGLVPGELPPEAPTASRRRKTEPDDEAPAP